MTNEEKIAHRIACPEAGYPLSEAQYTDEEECLSAKGVNFKQGDVVIYLEKQGYLWIPKHLDVTKPLHISRVSSEDGRGKLEFVEDPGHLYPDICFDYETDCEDAWCGESHTKEEIQANFEKAVKEGYSKSFDEYLLDYL